MEHMKFGSEFLTIDEKGETDLREKTIEQIEKARQQREDFKFRSESGSFWSATYSALASPIALPWLEFAVKALGCQVIHWLVSIRTERFSQLMSTRQLSKPLLLICIVVPVLRWKAICLNKSLGTRVTFIDMCHCSLKATELQDSLVVWIKNPFAISPRFDVPHICLETNRQITKELDAWMPVLKQRQVLLL